MIKYILIAASAVILLYFLCCYAAAVYALKRKKTKTKETFQDILASQASDNVREHARRCIERIETLQAATTETFCMESFDGLKLKAYYAPCGKETDTVVLLVHGYDSDAFTAFGNRIKMYTDQGFDTVVIDQRACGSSEGKHITFAVNESRDVAMWCDYIVNRFKNCKNIVLHGISLGGASVLLAIDKNLCREVKCIVDDCGFDSPYGILDHVLHTYYKLPCFIRKTVICFCEMICKCKFKGINTEDILKNTDLPILFIHGDLDFYVPYRMSVNNFKAVKRPFEFYTVKGASHAACFVKDEDGCNRAVERLLNFALKTTNRDSSKGDNYEG